MIRSLGTPYGEAWQHLVDAVKQNFSEMGIKVNIVLSDVAGWNQKISYRDCDLAST